MPPRRGLYHRAAFDVKLFHGQNVLFQLLLVGLLISDILADYLFIKPYATYAVSACPKVIAREIFAFAKISTVDQNGGFAFQPPHRLSHSILRRYAQAHVDMIRLSVAFEQTYFKLAA